MSDSKHAYPLILNKVASPHYATPTLRRARLIEWLDAASECRAAVIAADAGYGKTTLLWQWEREARVPVYWYKLDRSDRDWTFHVSYLIEAIGKHHRGFGRRANSMLQQLGGPGSARPGVVAYLLAEMHQRLTEPCTFIIDDWHYVNAATEVRGLWNQILRDAPATCRFIFASRVKPRLQFARFKTHAGYAELRTDALRFTEAEIDELFRDIYNDPLEPTELAELERKTEGWAASIRLVEVSLRQRVTPDERRAFIQSISTTRDSDLFEFLAEEVLDQESEVTRNFLLTTSILHQITPEVAARLAGVQDAQVELRGLEHRGLFTNRLDDDRYRYHNLFREFLQRRLSSDRSEAEVVGLHIHAASYFETVEQWPEAIHHYLKANLQRQAARLIAKHGEMIVSTGRLGLVDRWLEQLPHDTIRQNARLNLLAGEAAGIRGDWVRAIDSLERARAYFSRKGDRRLEALACLKLSSIYSNYGDVDQAATVAESGLRLAPDDAAITRLRLRGNLAVTRGMLSGSLQTVVDECHSVAKEASALGLDHFAAIGYHNAGGLLLRMGKVREAIADLETAAAQWSDTPTTPFGHWEDLIAALVLDQQIDRAKTLAAESLRRTAPWPRPVALARRSYADVLIAEGSFAEAITTLRLALQNRDALANVYTFVASSMVEALYLSNAPTEEIRAISDAVNTAPPIDPRHEAEVVAAEAIAVHSLSACSGACQSYLARLASAREKGANLSHVSARVKIGALALQHRAVGPKRAGWGALSEASREGYLRPLKWWARYFSQHASLALDLPGGVDLIGSLAGADPDGWRTALTDVLPRSTGSDREALLGAIAKYATRESMEALRHISGEDVDRAYRSLKRAHASRLFLRTLGGISLHRGGWDGPVIPIEKRRIRGLLAVLAAYKHMSLTRELAVDLLWPESDGDSAVNNLNQTVFQLRRLLDPRYHQGDSPEYVLSSSEQVRLADDLVRVDIEEIRALPQRLSGTTWAKRQQIAARAIALVRGEFLADMRYESWASTLQVSVHNEIRAKLLPIALDASAYDLQVSTDAAGALIAIDPYDETATLALADGLRRSGRSKAARDLLQRYAELIEGDIREVPEARRERSHSA